MLDPRVSQLAHERILVRFEERRSVAWFQLTQMQAELALRGLGRSGALIERVHQFCAREVEIRVSIVWQELKHVLAVVGVNYSETLAQDLKAEVERYADFSDLTAALKQTAKGVGIESPSLEDARHRALRRIGADIDLYALSLKRYLEQQQGRSLASQPVYNFQGPVGAVQIGSGATATVIQNVSQEDQESLRHALDFVTSALASDDQLEGFSKEQILDLVQDCRAEIEKPRPNLLKISSMVTGIATAIQTIASLQPAYQMLKAALAPFGINLPW